jgi:hypothetical protein
MKIQHLSHKELSSIQTKEQLTPEGKSGELNASLDLKLRNKKFLSAEDQSLGQVVHRATLPRRNAFGASPQVLFHNRNLQIQRRQLSHSPSTATPEVMDSTVEELNSLFAPSSSNGLPPDVLGELQSMLRLHSIAAQELFYKWESYSLKMGSEDTKLTLDTVRAFKKDVQDALERESRGKSHIRSADKRNGVGATPRAVTSNSDVFGMCVT